MKRFTATEKWDDSWFRKLTPVEKCFWSFICERCDCAGVWKVDLEAADFFIGSKLKEAALLDKFSARIQDIGGGRWWIVKFVEFQYGRLSVDCKPHIPIFKALERHGIPLDSLSKPFPKAIDSLEEKEKEKEKEEDKDQDRRSAEGEPNKFSPARIALHWLNEKAGRHYRETDRNLAQIQARIDEVKGDIDGIKQMIDRQCARWKGTPQQEYLRPETLFGTEKFNSYYDNRDQPVQVNGGIDKPNPRNAGITGNSEERTKRVLAAIERQQAQRTAAANGMAAAESGNGLHASSHPGSG